MDYLASLRRLIFALLLLGHAAVFAFPPPQVYYRESYTGSSVSAVCRAWLDNFDQSGWVSTIKAVSESGCTYESAVMRTDGTAGAVLIPNGWVEVFSKLDCPAKADKVLDGAGVDCVCKSGTVLNSAGNDCNGEPDGGGQKDPPGCKYGTSGTRNFTTGWSRKSAASSAAGDSDLAADQAAVAQAASFAGSQACDGQCAMNVGAPTKAWHSETPASNGMYRISVDFNVEFLGACSANQATTVGSRPNEIPPACDGYIGQVNGETTCVKSAASRPDTKQSTGVPLLKGNPAASSSADQSPAERQQMPSGWGADAGPGGASGGPPSSSFGEPRGAGGLAASAPPGGASSPGSGAPGSSDPGGSFCQENPTADICKPSSFSGACAGGFTCSGDAVSCAMAREQFNRNCQVFDLDTPLSSKGRDYVGWGSQPTPPGHPGASANIQNTTFAFSSLISMSSLGFNASCPNDRTFSGGGASFVIPFSQLCAPMQILGQVMVAICLLGSVAIVFRGGK